MVNGMEMGGSIIIFFLLCIMPVLSVGDQKNLSCVKKILTSILFNISFKYPCLSHEVIRIFFINKILFTNCYKCVNINKKGGLYYEICFNWSWYSCIACYL